MTMTATLVQPVRPALDRDTAMRLAATEYDRAAQLLQALRPADWNKPTECADWDVRQLAAHMLGMVEMAASVREQRRQQKRAGARQKQQGGLFIDALTGLQVDERADMTPDAIIERFARRGSSAVKGRRRAPGFVRRRTIPMAQDVGELRESWTFGYLIDVVLTRDPWMHRIDIARAAGVENPMTADHDGVIVADVVAEWAARHGRPFALVLTGPAGGQWSYGTGLPAITMDAADFCRAISGRGERDGLLAVDVPF